MIISQQIRKYRTQRNITQDSLADKMNISRQSISKWEQGTALPTVENLVMLSDILEIPLDELVKGKDSFPMPFHFGIPKNRVPFYIALIAPTLFLVFAINAPDLESVILLIAFALTSIGVTAYVSFFDFKRYYNYFTVQRNGLEVSVTSGGFEIIKIIKGVLGLRKTTFISYDNIDSMSLFFETKGFNQPNYEALNYRKRQHRIMREPFMVRLLTKDGIKYDLSLDQLFYPDRPEYHYFPAIMAYIKEKGIIIDDPFNLVEAIEKEYDIVYEAYKHKKEEPMRWSA